MTHLAWSNFLVANFISHVTDLQISECQPDYNTRKCEHPFRSSEFAPSAQTIKDAHHIISPVPASLYPERRVLVHVSCLLTMTSFGHQQRKLAVSCVDPRGFHHYWRTQHRDRVGCLSAARPLDYCVRSLLENSPRG